MRGAASPTRLAGWHDFQDGDRHCLVAALSLACDGPKFGIPNETERRLARQLAKQVCHGFTKWAALVSFRNGLMMFNDHRRTRHDDVVGLFDRAIHHAAMKAPLYVAAWLGGIGSATGNDGGEAIADHGASDILAGFWAATGLARTAELRRDSMQSQTGSHHA
jgi:hypothetical protein